MTALYKDPVSRKIDEITSLVDLPEYSSVIEKLIRKIYSSKCQIAVYQTRDYSSHIEEARSCIIWLKGINCDSDNKTFIWDMLHEFGHHLDEIKLEKKDEQDLELRRQREIRAWRFADEEFKNYPELQNNIEAYIDYKKRMLESYGI